MSIRIVVVDDHRLFREGLRALIASQPDLECLGKDIADTEKLAPIEAHRDRTPLADATADALFWLQTDPDIPVDPSRAAEGGP